MGGVFSILNTLKTDEEWIQFRDTFLEKSDPLKSSTQNENSLNFLISKMPREDVIPFIKRIRDSEIANMKPLESDVELTVLHLVFKNQINEIYNIDSIPVPDSVQRLIDGTTDEFIASMNSLKNNDPNSYQKIQLGFFLLKNSKLNDDRCCFCFLPFQ